mmetsp:Transcript_25537/g.43073  ORF Transcript_25537/g.43073 Transcript_25537/m.43073 type:complete len:326 (+) Transcript_25537:55-1032(+)|eukprot:CAMPEP_0114429310 /NCGR_PEP_ID=MMETSP0103-20121206/9410_1 /TAXON_ID=37642 ORGANISM="Paraphysomonas imperforata, Strain PA2" /NCGR_SAMPLE_ID=MMETSP0103 /ASSEMBLY_ACC=CAM_ASM_000201 /LENGTH=325 /DNA_ID=CAMNT_0001598623 /DNA_START=33 /DNA_END=1010 /DNA_ORIENTATION=+
MSQSEAPKKEIFYEKPIGTKGVAWGPAEKEEWFKQQSVKRLYQDEVLSKLDAFKADFEVVQYGKLTLSVNDYPLFAVKTRDWDNAKNTILVTGGVHGYETSGVQGALRFIETKMKEYEARFNIVVCPCVCPWGYETINRWNSDAIDPNRSFQIPNTPENNVNHIEETTFLMNYWESLNNTDGVVVNCIMHMDLHETTDTDVTTFGPALAARNGIEVEETTIPDGFYVVADSERPGPEFNLAIVHGVEKVTHLIPESDTCLGEVVVQRACFAAPAVMLGLCMGLTNAPFVCTTEVYPDSPTVTDEECTVAQVAAVSSGLDYVLTTL